MARNTAIIVIKVLVGLATAGLWSFIAFDACRSYAQQQPDPAVLQHIIPSLQAQRNEAQDRAALAEARAAQLADALRQAQDEVQRLKAEVEKMKADKPPLPQSP